MSAPEEYREKRVREADFPILVSADAAIAELEADLAHEKESGTIANEQWKLWMAKARDTLKSLGQAEAERDALRTAIVDYANGDSTVHPITALSKLVGIVEREGGE